MGSNSTSEKKPIQNKQEDKVNKLPTQNVEKKEEVESNI